MRGRRARRQALQPRNPCAQDGGPRRIWVVSLDGAAKAALATGRSRLLATGLFFALAFLAVGLRLLDLSLPSRDGGLVAAGQTDRGPEAPRQSRRADVVDRNGQILATTLPTTSLYANPRHLRDVREVAERLARTLPGVSHADLLERLASDRAFVWVRRNLTPRETAAVNRLGIPGLYFQDDERRFYPHGALVSHLVGFNGIDREGLAGIERAFDEQLRSSASPLSLSIDLRVQHVLTEELVAAMQVFRAVGAAGVVLDAHSGEILAAVSLPAFDPVAPGAASVAERFNRVTLGVYEMGSIFKIFTTAMALDSGVVGLQDGYDTTEPIRVARYTITDFKPKRRWLSIPEIFVYSSNIGTVHMAMAAGTERQRSFLGDLGLLRPAAIELREIGQPLVPSPWREINTMTVSYGHGLAVTPLQVVRAVAAIVNGGELVPLTLMKRRAGESVATRRVISAATSEQMRGLLRLVVGEGTGRKAEAPGYLVGGKTGTAEKLTRGGRYARDKRIASFVGAFPMNDPRYVVFAMVDEPKPAAHTHGYATGGWVAAPVVGRTVARMAPLLGLAPQPLDEDLRQQGVLLQAAVKENARAAR